ncbi:unnamed protein product [Rhizopus stolonifer]
MEELCNKYKKRMRGSPDELPLQTWEYHDKMSRVISQMPSSELEQLTNEDNTAKEDSSSSSPQPSFPAEDGREKDGVVSQLFTIHLYHKFSLFNKKGRNQQTQSFM